MEYSRPAAATIPSPPPARAISPQIETIHTTSPRNAAPPQPPHSTLLKHGPDLHSTIHPGHPLNLANMPRTRLTPNGSPRITSQSGTPRLIEAEGRVAALESRITPRASQSGTPRLTTPRAGLSPRVGSASEQQSEVTSIHGSQSSSAVQVCHRASVSQSLQSVSH